jgi:hypothetical protein
MKIKKSHLKELVKQSIISVLSEKDEEEKSAPPEAPEKEDEKPMTKIDDNPFKKDDMEEGGKGSGRPAKPGGAKDIENKAMSAADAANAKMDAAEKALKAKKKKKKVKESISKRFTVKEVRMWMKKLEENRYKKVYNSDARRVAWMVNNEGVELSEMPKSMSKKWTKAQYGRERYLAKEFIKSQKRKVTEGKLNDLLDESGILYRAGVKKYGKEGMKKIQQAAGKKKSHAEIGKIKDKYEKDKKTEQKIREQIKTIIRNELNEAKMIKLKIPIKDRKKAVHILQKQLKLKVSKDFEYDGKKGRDFFIELNKKFEDKVIDKLANARINIEEV